MANSSVKKSAMSSVQNVKKINKVPNKYFKEISNWSQLNALTIFLQRFEKTSPNEALSNALELKDLVNTLKENEKPVIFTNPSFTTRINILNNEVLRLADMTFIPAIKANEVLLQSEKIIEAYNAMVAKINAIMLKKEFEEALEIEVTNIGLDTTKIDSVSKKTIDKKIEEKRKSKKLKTKKLKEIPTFTNRKNG